MYPHKEFASKTKSWNEWNVLPSPYTCRVDFIDAVYFRRGLTCTLWLTNDLIDGGRPRAKPHLRQAKPNQDLQTAFSPQFATVYQVVGYSKNTC